jgi:flagellar biogenesis protein FliO
VATQDYTLPCSGQLGFLVLLISYLMYIVFKAGFRVNFAIIREIKMAALASAIGTRIRVMIQRMAHFYYD